MHTLTDDHKWLFPDVANRIERARQQLISAGHIVKENSALHQMFSAALDLANKTIPDGPNIRHFINALSVMRICDGIDLAITHISSSEALSRLCNSAADLASRDVSQAKDALFELEIIKGLHDQGAQWKVEEPDISIDLAGQKYGIACKKVYSDKKIPDRFRHGVHQIEASGFPGVVAINIDDLTPEHSLIVCETKEQAFSLSTNVINHFARKYTQKTGRYIASGRCDGILFCLTSVIDRKNEEPRISNAVQKILWTVRQASPQAKRRLQLFESLLRKPKAI